MANILLQRQSSGKYSRTCFWRNKVRLLTPERVYLATVVTWGLRSSR
jgi:hypothetical protein